MKVCNRTGYPMKAILEVYPCNKFKSLRCLNGVAYGLAKLASENQCRNTESPSGHVGAILRYRGTQSPTPGELPQLHPS